MEIAGLLLSLGIGGVLGAVAAVAFSALRLKGAFEAFSVQFRSYFAGRTDRKDLELVAAFEALADEVAAATSAIERLKRSLRRR